MFLLTIIVPSTGFALTIIPYVSNWKLQYKMKVKMRWELQ